MKIGVIGCGYWGKNLIRNFHKIGSLFAISDTDKNIAYKFSKEFKIPSMTFEELITSECDGVAIAAPAFMHAEMTLKALQNKKNVYVEKPLSLSLKDADEVIKVAEDNGCVLMVGHLLQYHPVFVELLKIVESKEFGSIKYIYSNRLSMGKVRKEEDVLWSFAPHDISMILSIAQSKVNQVSCYKSNILQSNIADISNIHMEFENGISGHISVSWLNPFKEHKLVVIGDKKMIVFEDTEIWEKKLSISEYNFDNSSLNVEKKDSQYINIPQAEPLMEECKHFIKLINKEVQNITDGIEGRKVLEILTKANEYNNNLGKL